MITTVRPIPIQITGTDLLARHYYAWLIRFQKLWFWGAVGSIFIMDDPISYLAFFALLNIGTLLSKINILLEVQFESDPDFWDMNEP